MKPTRNPWARTGAGLAWHLWLPVLLVAGSLLLSQQFSSHYFPPLRTIAEQTWVIWFDGGGMAENLLPSLLRLLAGFCAAVVAGVLLGTLLGLMPRTEEALRPLTDSFRAIPGAALLPIALMFFGTGEAMKIVLIAFISMWPIMLNTIDGVRSVNPTLGQVMESFKLRPLDRFWHIYLPAAAPQVFAGARTALAIGVAVMVVVEMFGTPGGLGYFIRHAQENFQVVAMWTGMLVLGVFGYLLNALFRAFEKRILNWHHAMVAHTQGASS
ncbi:ABC transporter permease [Arthrobacter sp. I2-34]|uniref:ABC transporter permease n=1 Tax=Arthrobacter hankyongi TaxID=2904801 RepID=A0ABS9L7I6_9MICC|nr:ABC transporter permease [Arthrobacter hankyongi]MCG2622632.1 ABC transporter permease [Arthrobacter hankyongi]